MDELIQVINELTDALPEPGKLAAAKPSARDWAAFFAALSAFAAKLLPLILPLFMAEEETPTE